MKKESIRTDLLTRKTYRQSELLRLVVEDGHLVFDRGEAKPGRGYYLLPSLETLKLLENNKASKRLPYPLKEGEIKFLEEKIK